ncbi:lipopolysaccharide assembly protein LapA domain-containing protein [Streptomyces sp. NPDC101158]|uniref:lipopolysaccharide assembly protein LapA domain-containing protein n=1 Tax=Streptomyces sp. NPDC101158 TaxID=3366117 RepID=UPI00382C144D
MSPKETATATTGEARAGGVVTPGRITLAAVAVLTLVLVFENTREVRISLLIAEVSTPLCLALLATTLLGAVCGFYAAHRRTR